MPLWIEPGEYLDLVEAAGVIGIHPESLRRLVRYGEVAVTTIERGIYFSREAVDQFKKSYRRIH